MYYNKLWLTLRDRPFNLKGGLWFFVSFRIFFSDNTRVRIFIFLSHKARIFFSEFNIRLYDKNSESDYFFFSATKIRIFFSATLGIRIFFLEKNHNPPLRVKWSFPKVKLGTLVTLESEKHLIHIFLQYENHIPIYIIEVQKLCLFLYYSIFGNPFIY